MSLLPAAAKLSCSTDDSIQDESMSEAVLRACSMVAVRRLVLVILHHMSRFCVQKGGSRSQPCGRCETGRDRCSPRSVGPLGVSRLRPVQSQTEGVRWFRTEWSSMWSVGDRLP